MKLTLRPIFTCMALLCLSACKKTEDTHQPYPSGGGMWCNISSSVTTHNGCTDSVFFESPYRATRLLYFNDCQSGIPGNWMVRAKSFVYDGNKIYLIDTGNFQGTDTLIVNADQQIQEVHGSQASGNIVVRYEYDAAGRLIRDVNYQFGILQSITQYLYNSGDLVMIAIPGEDTIRYTYYPDKMVPTSGYLTQQGYRYGSAYTYRNAHLIKSVSGGGGGDLSYSYFLDGNGNIDTMITTVFSGTPYSDTTRYHYACVVE